MRFKMVHSDTKNAKSRVRQFQVCYLLRTTHSSLRDPLLLKIRGNCIRYAGADPGMGQTGTGPPFWQLNHKHSAYFRALSANFPPISTLGPLFLQIMDPALDMAIENKNIEALHLFIDWLQTKDLNQCSVPWSWPCVVYSTECCYWPIWYQCIWYTVDKLWW